MGTWRSAHRPRRGLLPPTERRGACPHGSGGDGHANRAPAEEWLFKAYDGPILVDLIFCPAGGPIGDEHFERATQMEVGAQTLLVASIDDVLVTRLLALSEQEPNFQAVIELARALREQFDWEAVRSRSGDSPFARAFFTLVEGLGIVESESSLQA